jgi:hypothetical protein
VPDYGALLRELVPFFEREQIRFALGGGFALQALGRSRLTFDLDLIVDGSAQDRIVRHMEEIGFETLRVAAGYSNHLRSRQRVDFIYLQSKTAELVLKELRVRETREGVPVPVARPEHLAMMKFLAVKNNPERDRQDLPDLGFLLRVPGINREEIREYCAQHGMLDLFNELTRE